MAIRAGRAGPGQGKGSGRAEVKIFWPSPARPDTVHSGPGRVGRINFFFLNFKILNKNNVS